MTTVANDTFFAENWKYLLAALVLHVAAGLLMTVTMNATRQTVTPATLAIKATVVDHTAQRMKREKEQAEAARTAREQAESEEKAREQAEAEQKQREQEKVALEAKRQEVKRTEDKRQQQLAADKKRKVEEQQHQTAVKQQSAADEKKRATEIKTKQVDKQKAERDAHEQALRENELRRQLADEEGRMAVENAGLLSQYAALIEQRVVRNWNKPASARAGIQCELKITQAMGGTVLSVQIDKCNGDEAVRQSIEAAVLRSSPLPPPPDARLFQRVIVFVFKPSE